MIVLKIKVQLYSKRTMRDKRFEFYSGKTMFGTNSGLYC